MRQRTFNTILSSSNFRLLVLLLLPHLGGPVIGYYLTWEVL